jgi:penicillin-binding protein 2
MGPERKNIILGVILLVSLVFIVRLFILQIVDPSYKLSASSNVLRYITQYPSRGLVFDRNGKMIVYNEPAYDLMLIPAQLSAFDTLEFCTILDITVEKVQDEIKKAREYSPFIPSIFLKQISTTTYAVFQEKLYKFPGFYVQPRTLRRYDGNYAAHILGYVGEVDERMISEMPYYRMGDYIGVSGIESTYENELRGRKGVNIYLVDVHNRIKESYQEGRYDTIATVGKNLTLTIDSELQEYSEKLMQNKTGSIVAIEPSTGEILTLVSAPTFSPDLLVGRQRTDNYATLARDTLKPLFNRALMAFYPPGSVFKVVNGLVALQERLLFPSTMHSCGGAYVAGRLSVACRFHISPLNLSQAIQYSCNTYFCHVFRNILDAPKYGSVTEGFNVWRNHLLSFGLGEKLGTDFPNELRGNVPSPQYYDRYYGENRWRSIQLISLAIGQGELGVTPIQMANMTAIIANRGYYKTPHIVKEIEGKESIHERFLEKQFTTIDSVHFEVIVNGMEEAVNSEVGGTARIARIPGIIVCGKTGTVQNPTGKIILYLLHLHPGTIPKLQLLFMLKIQGLEGPGQHLWQVL